MPEANRHDLLFRSGADAGPGCLFPLKNLPLRARRRGPGGDCGQRGPNLPLRARRRVRNWEFPLAAERGAFSTPSGSS